MDDKLGVVALGENGAISFKLVRMRVKPITSKVNLDFNIPFSVPVDLKTDTCVFDLLDKLPSLKETNLTFLINPSSKQWFFLDETNVCYTNFGALNSLQRTIQVFVSVTQKDFPINTGTIRIDFQVGNQNNYAPLFSQNGYTFTISPDATTGTEVGTVHAIDSDRGGNPYGVLRYRLVNSQG